MPWTPHEDISLKQTELATSLRVPFIKHPYPRWYYVVAVVVPDERRPVWHGEMPTDDELRMVASFIDEYREYWYRDSYKQKMRDLAPYDIDGGAVGTYLVKHANGGWGYRKHTWEYGPCFVPMYNADPEPLEQVLDRVHSHGSGPLPKRWLEWKSSHPEVFAAVSS